MTESVTEKLDFTGRKLEMMELVLNKIDMEYEFYFMDMMKSTKENIFAKSKEIELKKAIVLFLKGMYIAIKR